MADLVLIEPGTSVFTGGEIRVVGVIVKNNAMSLQVQTHKT